MSKEGCFIRRNFLDKTLDIFSLLLCVLGLFFLFSKFIAIVYWKTNELKHKFYEKKMSDYVTKRYKFPFLLGRVCIVFISIENGFDFQLFPLIEY
jgi:hypothetical protein